MKFIKYVLMLPWRALSLCAWWVSLGIVMGFTVVFCWVMSFVIEDNEVER